MPTFPQPLNRTFSAVSANHTAATGDVVLGTSGSGGITVTLPPVGEGGPVTVRKVDSGTGALTVKTADGAEINGIAGTTGVSTTTQWAGWTFETDGTNWWQTAS